MALGSCGEPGGAATISAHLRLANRQVSSREASTAIIHAVHGSKGQGARVWVASRRTCSLGPVSRCSVDRVYASTQAVCRWEDNGDLHY